MKVTGNPKVIVLHGSCQLLLRLKLSLWCKIFSVLMLTINYLIEFVHTKFGWKRGLRRWNEGLERLLDLRRLSPNARQKWRKERSKKSHEKRWNWRKKLLFSALNKQVRILDSTLDRFFTAKRPNRGSTMRPQWGEKGEGKGEGKGENERKNDKSDAKKLCFLLYITTYTS